jgi:hypothetical protein
MDRNLLPFTPYLKFGRPGAFGDIGPSDSRVTIFLQSI